MVYYPNLVSELAKRGIKKTLVANSLGICDKSLRNKMTGKVAFTWPEVQAIRKCFFPDLDPGYLFETTEEQEV